MIVSYSFFLNPYISKTYSKSLFNALPSNIYDNFLVKSFSTAKICFAFEDNNEKWRDFLKEFSVIDFSHLYSELMQY